jgi:hypothetical protein
MEEPVRRVHRGLPLLVANDLGFRRAVRPRPKATVETDLVARGGHVRVGLEDLPWGSHKKNRALVEEAARLVRAAGGEPATASEIRHGCARAPTRRWRGRIIQRLRRHRNERRRPRLVQGSSVDPRACIVRIGVAWPLDSPDRAAFLLGRSEKDPAHQVEYGPRTGERQ